jgi:hypothetical protein
VGTSNTTHLAILHSKLWPLQINMAESLIYRTAFIGSPDCRALKKFVGSIFGIEVLRYLFFVLRKLSYVISGFVDNFISIFPYEISAGSEKMSVWSIKKDIFCINF